MNAITHPQKTHCRVSRNETATDPSQMLDVLLALDRMVVEVSMHLYNVKRQDRSQIRHSNRRLHAAVRKQLPRLLIRAMSHEL
ncbi:MAG TPA: hypothetical protein VKQ11_02130 [Candidatus Sulfotelmatobacter sp.]|nr:hypothetical protein [Candidatus Sulfotelmatobacter sp.]